MLLIFYYICLKFFLVYIYRYFHYRLSTGFIPTVIIFSLCFIDWPRQREVWAKTQPKLKTSLRSPRKELWILNSEIDTRPTNQPELNSFQDLERIGLMACRTKLILRCGSDTPRFTHTSCSNRSSLNPTKPSFTPSLSFNLPPHRVQSKIQSFISFFRLSWFWP